MHASSGYQLGSERKKSASDLRAGQDPRGLESFVARQDSATARFSRVAPAILPPQNCFLHARGTGWLLGGHGGVHLTAAIMPGGLFIKSSESTTNLFDTQCPPCHPAVLLVVVADTYSYFVLRPPHLDKPMPRCLIRLAAGD